MRVSHCLGLLALALSTACTPAATPDAAAPAAPTAAADAPAARNVATVAEAFLTPMTPDDNIDSPASWTTPDGAVWLIATAKATDKLVVYDGQTGAHLRDVGSAGTAQGQFDRPNGIAVVDDLVLIVERDNHRVQVLQLPDFKPLGVFAGADLRKPYGLWVNKQGQGYDVYVTDSYHAGEDAQGNDVLPPLAELDKRVRRYALTVQDGKAQATLTASIGDTGQAGALRVVESIWGDPANDRLLIAEEDESYASELKVYTLAGRFTGTTFGRDAFKAQAEGVMLRTCGKDGWWITTEQGRQRSVFHLFDRHSLKHVGAFQGNTVANTDGIWSMQAPSARFPHGALYAVHDDQGVVAFDWASIARQLSLPLECGA
ncbi:phytase [Stenotrophomonas rhizophila]|uniref:phytase n=1 Tax=Stenotrophomonas rhizophila TaxID=216778 RepID=UPI001E59129C|nr:phytase [Stenotrophomonas rhizophila]MCC7635881.1 phytase [Stenotrophomonas rhizophila]MCC7665142.1 phytase [Stenotrophomonas rhizophila]